MTDTPENPTLKQVPLLPLRDIIVFPHMVVPLFVGRERSIAALEQAMSGDKEIMLSAQRKAKTNNPQPGEIFDIGTLATIIQLLRLPDGTVKVLVEGNQRMRVVEYVEQDEYFLVQAELQEQELEVSVEAQALMRSLKSTFEIYVKLNKRIPPEMLVSVQTVEEPSRLVDTIGVHLQLKLEDK